MCSASRVLRGRFGHLLLAASTIAILAVSTADAQSVRVGMAGTLDRSFGRAGTVVTDLRTPGSLTASVSASDLALGPLGQLVAVGSAFEYGGRDVDAWILLFSSRGRLERQFGVELRGAGSVAAQRDGRILVGGAHEGLIRRYLANGDADATFGTRGSVLIAEEGRVKPIVLGPRGRIVALVSSFQCPATGCETTTALVGYEADGTPDRTFGANGVVRLPFWSPEGLAVGPDGWFLVVGRPHPRAEGYVVRVSPQGVQDTSFGSSGSIALRRGAVDVLAGRNGAVVVGESWIARLTTAGRLDTSFGTRGFVALRELSAADAALQRNGAIVVAGWSGLGAHAVGALVRLRANGTLDRTFARRGRATLPLARTATRIDSVVIQGDGKIVVAASAGTRLLLARYHA